MYEPIITWNGVIVDGHNRWRVIQEKSDLPYRVKEMEFADKWEAFEWMYKKQLGRRNLTVENKTYLMGKVLETRKKRVGNSSNVRDELGRFQLHQTDGNGERKRGTSGEIAKELGVGSATVERAEKFAQGVDAIRLINPAAATSTSTGLSGQRYTRKRMTLRRKRKAVTGGISTQKWQSSNPNLAKLKKTPALMPEKPQLSSQTSLA